MSQIFSGTSDGGNTFIHPGYVANNWYTGFHSSHTGSTNIPTNTVTYLTPFPIFQKCTVGSLGVSVTTAVAAQNVQLALYSSNSGATPAVNRPGSLLSNTGSISTQSLGVQTASLLSNQQLTAGSWYWFALQFSGSATFKFNALQTDAVIAPIIGSATAGNVIATASGTISGLQVTMSFGTWTSDISGFTFTETTSTTNMAPVPIFQVVSIP